MSRSEGWKARFRASRLGPLFYELRELGRNPLGQLEVWRDFLQSRREFAAIRREVRALQAKAGAKRVLVASMSDSVFQLKLEASLAFGLARAGCQVSVLTTSPLNVWGKRYFRAFGFERFVYWDELRLPPEQRQEAQQAAAAVLDAGLQPSFRSVKALQYKESWIGPQVISWIARLIYQGAPDFSDPKAMEHLRRVLPETIERVELAKVLFDSHPVDLIYLIEPNYTTMGPIVDVAVKRGIDVIQVTHPSKDDALYFKRLNSRTRRFHCSSVDPATLAHFMRLPWDENREAALAEEIDSRYNGRWFLQARNQRGVREFECAEICESLHLDPGKPIATIFSHVLWDANLFYGEDLFEDYQDWFVQSMLAACSNPKVNWIIKLHPANAWKRARERKSGRLSEEELIEKWVGKLPPHVVLLFPDTKISTKSLYECSDFGITVRGTPGMELACFGKTVVTAGTGRYSGLGFTLDSSSKEEYLQLLAKLPDIPRATPHMLALAKWHALVALHYRPWAMRSFRATFRALKQGAHPLENNLHPAPKAGDFADLGRWAKWATESEAVDYVEE